MVNIAEVRGLWTTEAGGTGYSVFHFQGVSTQADAQNVSDLVEDFFTQVRVVIPPDNSITMDTEVRILEDTTGQLQSTFTVTNAGSLGGTGTDGYAAGVGTAVRWDTGRIVAGRRLRGRTFICPMSEGTYGADGKVDSPFVANIQGPATILAGAPGFVVWSRTHGQSWPVLSAQVPGNVSWLLSRKR